MDDCNWHYCRLVAGLIMQVPDAELALVQQQLPLLMQSVARLDVPLLAEVGTGNNWEAAH